MEELIMTYEDKMEKSLDNLYGEYTSIRAGRANPHILDKITVDYYGSPTPLQQVGNISVPEARMIVIQPWEASILKDIENHTLILKENRHNEVDMWVSYMAFVEAEEIMRGRSGRSTALN